MRQRLMTCWSRQLSSFVVKKTASTKLLKPTKLIFDGGKHGQKQLRTFALFGLAGGHVARLRSSSTS